MHRRKIMLNSSLALKKKKMLGPTTKMRRIEIKTWVSQTQFCICCYRAKTAGGGGNTKIAYFLPF